MIFFIRLQQKHLNSLTKKVGTQRAKQEIKLATPDTKKILADAQHSYSLYSFHTKTLLGKIKSFLPYTKPYNARLNCAEKTKLAFIHLHDIKKQLNQPPVLKAPPREFGVVKCQSDPTLGLPRVYPSPILTAKPIQRSISAEFVSEPEYNFRLING